MAERASQGSHSREKWNSEVAQSCPTLCDPIDCSLPGSSIHGIFQARILEWGAIAFSATFPNVLFFLQKKKKQPYTPGISSRHEWVRGYAIIKHRKQPFSDIGHEAVQVWDPWKKENKKDRFYHSKVYCQEVISQSQYKEKEFKQRLVISLIWGDTGVLYKVKKVRICGDKIFKRKKLYRERISEI